MTFYYFEKWCSESIIVYSEEKKEKKVPSIAENIYVTQLEIHTT